MRKFYLNNFSDVFRKNLKLLLTIPVALFTFSNATSQLAECKDKFLGNIMPSSWRGQVVRSDYSTYWNQVTPENAAKWGSVENSRDNYNWGDLDQMYNYCMENDFVFKHHVIVWGNQQPSWIGSLSQEEQRQELEEWYALFAERYPNTEILDVVNESLPGHAEDIMFREAIGGLNNGANVPYLSQNADKYGPYGTGWDYIIYSFAKAREYFPNATLVLNDYNIINSTANIDAHLEIVNILKERGLIDAVGIQAHNFSVDNMSGQAITRNLDRLASAGLPIHVTELDITGSNEQQQRDRYATIFPAFWEHPDVTAVTLWGYVEGETWKEGTGILNADGSERMAMQWLKQYMASQPDVCVSSGAPEVSITSPETNASTEGPANISLEATASDEDGSINSVAFYEGTTLLGTVNSAPYKFEWNDVEVGNYKFTAVATDNEGNTTTSRPVSYTVTGNIVVRAAGTDGSETLELIVDGQVLTTWTLSTGFALYSYDGPSGGTFRLNFNNDTDGRDVQIDYFEIDGVTYQAEDQQVNTGYYANGECGGGEYSEILHCDGYIQFDVVITGTTSPGLDQKFSVYPNPTNGKVFLTEAQNWTLFNSLGELVSEGSSEMVDVSAFPAGVYVLISGEERVKIVKK